MAGMTRLAATAFCILAVGESCAEDMASLLARCAPSVHPATMSRIINVESRGHPFALSDDGPEGRPWSVRKTMLRSFQPASKEEATALAISLTKSGHIVGIGLTQVNSRNLERLGLSIDEALEPCRNLQAGARLLTAFYLDALQRYGDAETALLAAISAYNTGSFINGFHNGYVARILAAREAKVPPVGSNRQAASSFRFADKWPPSAARRAGLLAAKVAVLEVKSY